MSPHQLDLVEVAADSLYPQYAQAFHGHVLPSMVHAYPHGANDRFDRQRRQPRQSPTPNRVVKDALQWRRNGAAFYQRDRHH